MSNASGHKSPKVLSPRILARLASLLGTLPDMLTARLAHAVALDRAGGGTDLPHDAILEALRPRLRRLYETRERERGALQRILETVPREVHAALPIRSFGGFGSVEAPLDLSASPDGKSLRRATRLAEVFTRLNGPAAAHGLERRLGTARADLVSSVQTFQRGVVREIRAARACDHAEAYRRPALELGAKLLPDSDLEDLRRVRALG